MVHKFDPEPEASHAAAAVSEKKRLADERKDWAQALGKRKQPGPERDSLAAEAPPGYSIWDLAKRPPTKSELKRKAAERELEAKRLGKQRSAAAPPSKLRGVDVSALVSTPTPALPSVVVPLFTDVPVLFEFVGSQLIRWGKRLWSAHAERRLRRRCMQETLYRQAQLRFHDYMTTSTGSWEALFLQDEVGRAQIARFVDEKVRELCAKEALG